MLKVAPSRHAGRYCLRDKLEVMAKISKPPSIDLQERDTALFLDLFESRIMTLDHMALLHFGGSKEAAKKRVQKLKSAGFITERARRPYEPSVLYLTRKAFKHLHEGGHLSRYPQLGATAFERRAIVADFTIRHELDVMSVKAALVGAIRQTKHFETVEFSTWPRLFQFHARPPATQGKYAVEMLIKPDGFIRIHEHEDDGGLSEHVFFLEVDRSTETQSRLGAKAACYANYYKSGGLAMRFGRPREEFAAFPFRVLMVFPNAERRNNTAETLLSLHPPILTQVWLTTFDEATKTPLDAIWVRPVDYREAVPGASDRQSKELQYRRNSSRDDLIERNVKKSALLSGQAT